MTKIFVHTKKRRNIRNFDGVKTNSYKNTFKIFSSSKVNMLFSGGAKRLLRIALVVRASSDIPYLRVCPSVR